MTGKSGHRGWGYLRELPSGRWQASYLGPDRRRHKAPSTFRTKSEGSYWLEGQRVAIDVGTWRSPADLAAEQEAAARQAEQEAAAAVTFAEYAPRWLAARELRPRTVAGYRKLLDRFLMVEFGTLPLREITRVHVRSWYTEFGPDKASMRAHTYQVLATIMKSAAEDGLIPASPCDVKRGAKAPKRHRTEPATVAELDKITAAMPERLRALTQVTAWCALRFGEAAELRRKDVDITDGTAVLHVRRAVSRADRKDHIGDPKSRAGIRDITVPPHVVPLLAAHLLRWSQPGADGLIFPGHDGRRRLTTSSLFNTFQVARQEAGRADLRWHDLRHTGLTAAARTGATLAELMKRAGHSTTASALVYQHAARGRDAAIAAELSKLAGSGQL